MSDSISDLTESAPDQPTGEVVAIGDRWIEDGVRDEETNDGDGVHRRGVSVLNRWLGTASSDPRWGAAKAPISLPVNPQHWTKYHIKVLQ